MQRLSQKVQSSTLKQLKILILIKFLFLFGTSLTARTPQPALGKLVFQAAGGCGCHTDVENGGPLMAGGRTIKTPFGVFYGTNITPDLIYGIGSWTDADFIRAMTEGVAPNGSNYFPVFPYTSFTLLHEKDLLHLKDFLFSLNPDSTQNQEHDVSFPFNWRKGVSLWKKMFFKKRTFIPDKKHTDKWNRGAYLSEALAHCGECHTPRNLLGSLDRSMNYAGSKDGPEGELAPNITPDKKTGIGVWSRNDLKKFLVSGIKPNGDDIQGLMAEAIVNGYRHLTEEDLEALAEYLESIPPIHHSLDNEHEEEKEEW